MRILIIGIGGFGFRHLQALSDVEGIKLTVVDSNPSAAESAKQHKGIQFDYYRSIDEVSGYSFDWTIISTGSKPRYELFKFVLEHDLTSNILLEKVLFSGLDQYLDCTELLKAYPYVNAYVNFPRRSWPFYNQLKEYLYSRKNVSLDIVGENVGLTCVGIHFVDLFEYLSGDPCESLYIDAEGPVTQAKRSGYLEFEGAIKIKSHFMSLNFVSSQSAPFDGLVFLLRCDEGSLIYSERLGVLFDEIGFKWDGPALINQSQLTGYQLENHHLLPKLADVLDTQYRFARACADNFNRLGYDIRNEVPIT